MKHTKEYTLYKGDTFIDLGTLPYLARKTGVKQASLKFYGSPSYRKRTNGNGMILIELEVEK